MEYYEALKGMKSCTFIECIMLSEVSARKKDKYLRRSLTWGYIKKQNKDKIDIIE